MTSSLAQGRCIPRRGDEHRIDPARAAEYVRERVEDQAA